MSNEKIRRESRTVSVAEISSDSVDERTIKDCFFDDQETSFPPTKIKILDVDFLSWDDAQSASLYAEMLVEVDERYVRAVLALDCIH